MMVMNIDPGYILAVIVVILMSMTLHEAMHAFTSYWLGDDTAKLQGRLTLNPIAHIDPFLTLILPIFLAIAGLPIFGGAKPVPFNPNRVRYEEFGAALVGIAGPLTNFVLAFIAYAVFALAGAPSTETPLGLILQLAIIVNLGFFIFNMLPIPPLDGSRVLYALAPEGARRVMETIEQYGVLLIFAVVLLAGPLLGQFMSAAISFFLQLFAQLFGVSVI
jgi:Zn-dependent protease